MSDLADRFRREGMADAVVVLVAKRIHPTTTAEEWGRILGLRQREVIDAVRRFREKHTPAGASRKRRRYQGAPLPCSVPGCGVTAVSPQGLAAHMRSHERRCCRWCGTEFNRMGVGPHERLCSHRPHVVA